MSITINGSGSITGLVSGGLPDGSVTAADIESSLDLSGKTVTLPAGTGGKVLQVVQGRIAGNVSTTSTSLQDTGLVVSITPSSTSSKILVTAGTTNTIGMDAASITGELQYQVNGGGYSKLAGMGGDAAYEGGSGTGTTDNYVGSLWTSYLLSPSTTSQVDFKVKFKNGQGSGTAYFVAYTDQYHTITLMEIAG